MIKQPNLTTREVPIWRCEKHTLNPLSVNPTKWSNTLKGSSAVAD